MLPDSTKRNTIRFLLLPSIGRRNASDEGEVEEAC